MTKSTELLMTVVDSATSSSDLAWRAAADGALAGAGFLVREQTAGRGRRGAGWVSQRGGMYFSLLLRPDIPVRDWFGFSFVAALAIREEIARYLPDRNVGVKWPNDLIVGGGKICGILLEGRDGAVVIGTGVNIVSQAGIVGTKLPAASIADFSDSVVDPEMLARAYAGNLLARVSAYEKNGFAPVRTEWLEHCVHIGQTLRVMLANGGNASGGDAGVREGVFADLGEDGALMLDASDGTHHKITTGDVELMGTL
ncbi:biotin--[acetyl-CoA-carboxylase] ligase [SAR116 cluster bacterium]|nr:biotin--[acetyl-CoA-carboxylase] ligase [SAR116 cluster bacterium]